MYVVAGRGKVSSARRLSSMDVIDGGKSFVDRSIALHCIALVFVVFIVRWVL